MVDRKLTGSDADSEWLGFLRDAADIHSWRCEYYESIDGPCGHDLEVIAEWRPRLERNAKQEERDAIREILTQHLEDGIRISEITLIGILNARDKYE